jgi:hypothetical protein
MYTKFINQWVEGLSDIALKKLMSNEPLTFEDNIIFALIGQREEIRKIDYDITDIKIEIKDIHADIKEFRRSNDDLRKEIINQTRWIITAIVALPVLLKLIDAVLGK